MSYLRLTLTFIFFLVTGCLCDPLWHVFTLLWWFLLNPLIHRELFRPLMMCSCWEQHQQALYFESKMSRKHLQMHFCSYVVGVFEVHGEKTSKMSTASKRFRALIVERCTKSRSREVKCFYFKKYFILTFKSLNYSFVWSVTVDFADKLQNGPPFTISKPFRWSLFLTTSYFIMWFAIIKFRFQFLSFVWNSLKATLLGSERSFLPFMSRCI